ncbi:methyl-accepting chemotaxis protein [Gracilibacillus halophilus YIM-C55.5]|uniref:Methyl-accepting chemotaxis protein n=1 Tax=Gracilibacillus halophilus YIM-C55.5 TaxID=1308866 RepID=N4WUF9_9BACI|nr:methyl-accepting chemotaxis protein [Gracilibacillus halophilus]ENH97980.1 methyl-accepting chemotaxis protein [Gracilibacillus halophilus YIM-C55.5]
MKNQKKGVSLRMKLVVFTTLLALITYSTSAFFIYFLQEWIRQWIDIPEVVYVLVTLALGIIWSGILAFVAAGFITRKLTELKNAATRIAEGDLKQDIEIPKSSNDEIGALTQAFQTMVNNLKRILADMEEHTEKTSQSVHTMKEAASRSKEHSDTLEDTIGQISQGAEETSEAIQQTAEAVDNSTQLATKVDEKAESSQQQSQEMVEKLDESKQVITTLVDGITKLAENQDHALHDVNRLSDKAKEVENVISLVGDISEQTNLLALNASIEASRAGEEGKGFAVVAEEVRKLADQSSEAVQSISNLIQDMQKDVELVVQNMRTHVDETRDEAKRGDETTTVIDNMSSSVHGVADSIREISSLVDHQLQEIEATQAKSQNVAAIAEETSAGAEEIRATIEEQANFAENLQELATTLEQQAENLKVKMNQFKLN